jgi:hypothetical protein
VGPEPRWDAALRLLAGVHYLVLAGRAPELASAYGGNGDVWPPFRAVLEREREWLRRFVAEQRVQTNEVQRAWTLLPCFLEAARRLGADTLDVIELGPSAGLNLVWDRYRYRYARGSWGPQDAALELAGEERRPVPASLLRERPRVGRRVGIDLAPVDVTTDEGALLLRAFVWADQHDRLARLERAIAALREDPPELVRADLLDELPRQLARRRPDALTLVFQTAVLGYVSREDRARVRSSLADAGADGPLAYVATERPSARDGYFGLVLRLWPGDGRREFVAHADFHGAWLSWL